MAKTDKAVGAVKVRVLTECALGKANDVVSIDADQIEAMAGVVDPDPAAVKYAESLAE